MTPFPKEKFFLINDRARLYRQTTSMPNSWFHFKCLFAKYPAPWHIHTLAHTHAHTHMQSKNQFHLWKHAHKGMIVLQASPLHPPHPTLQAYHPEVTLGFFMVMPIHISCNSDLTWSTASWAHVSPRSCLHLLLFFFRLLCNFPFTSLSALAMGKGKQAGCREGGGCSETQIQTRVGVCQRRARWLQSGPLVPVNTEELKLPHQMQMGKPTILFLSLRSFGSESGNHYSSRKKFPNSR